MLELNLVLELVLVLENSDVKAQKRSAVRENAHGQIGLPRSAAIGRVRVRGRVRGRSNRRLRGIVEKDSDPSNKLELNTVNIQLFVIK